MSHMQLRSSTWSQKRKQTINTVGEVQAARSSRGPGPLQPFQDRQTQATSGEAEQGPANPAQGSPTASAGEASWAQQRHLWLAGATAAEGTRCARGRLPPEPRTPAPGPRQEKPVPLRAGSTGGTRGAWKSVDASRFYAHVFTCVWRIASTQCQDIIYIHKHTHTCSCRLAHYDECNYQFLFCIHTYRQSIIKTSESPSHAKAT